MFAFAFDNISSPSERFIYDLNKTEYLVVVGVETEDEVDTDDDVEVLDEVDTEDDVEMLDEVEIDEDVETLDDVETM